MSGTEIPRWPHFLANCTKFSSQQVENLMQFAYTLPSVMDGARAATIAFAIAAAVCIFLAPPATAKWERGCGSVREPYRDQGGGEYILASKILGREAGCRTARHVAHAYASRSHYARIRRDGERTVRNRFPRAVGRFRCSAEYLGSDIRHITCRNSSASVDFDWYDSSGYH